MTLVGDAIKKVYNPYKINYEILGNLDEFVHAHVFPRYKWEGENVKHSVRRYSKDKFIEESNQFINLDNKEEIIYNLKEILDKLKSKYYQTDNSLLKKSNELIFTCLQQKEYNGKSYLSKN